MTNEGDDKFAEMSDGRPALFELYPCLDETAAHRLFRQADVNLPGATVHLKHYDQSHSRGDATAYFAEDDVFFAGDLLYTEFHPVTVNGRIEGWIKTLAQLSEVNSARSCPVMTNAHPIISITKVIPSM